MTAQNIESAPSRRGWSSAASMGRTAREAGSSVSPAALPLQPLRFVWSYIQARPFSFALLAAMVVAAASAAVGIQYMMKLLVDGMSSGPDHADMVWKALAAFIALIVVENALWRASGWLGCRTTIAVGRDIRLDLFSHLSGHPMQFFSDRFAGALGHRLTATAGNFGALVNTMVWRVTPPCVDFVGA